MIPLAYAPEPIEDEPLDGWLERIATATMSGRTQLLRERELPSMRWESPLRDFAEHDYERVAELTDVPVERLRRMTFQRWHHLGLAPSSDKRGHQGGAWARTNLHRYCPECLVEREGIHRIHWRVVWSFACIRHQLVLAGADPLSGPYGPPAEAWPSVRLPLDHPILVAQQAVDDVLDDRSHTVRSLGVNRHGSEYLSDLGALARVVVNLRNFESSDGFMTRLQEETGCDWSMFTHAAPRVLSSKTPALRLSQAIESPALTAVAGTVAHSTLAATSPDECGRTLWWMPAGSRKELMWHAASRQISFPLWSALASSETSQRRTTFLKRFHLTRRDQRGRLLSPIDPTKIPSSCWESVVKPSPSHNRDLEAAACSAALLMMGSERPVGDALERLGLSHLRSRIQTDWGDSFDSTPEGTANYEYLVELHCALATATIPIDYARRRRIFDEPEPLGRNTKSRLMKELGVRDTPWLGYYASWYLHELLTGSAWLLSKAFIDLGGGIRAQYRRWRHRWNAVQPKVYFELAEEALYRNNIDEPVTWQPERQNGMWIMPNDEGIRHLSLWANSSRPRRTSARLTDAELSGYSLADAVAVARSSGPVAEIMRRDLLRFEAVASHGSIKNGARAAGVNPGTLSVAISRFERRLGQQLFDRTSNPVKLTPSGRRLASLMRDSDQTPTEVSPLTEDGPS
jgi:hypothetical protein